MFKRIRRGTRTFLRGLLKQWLGYVFQGAGAVAALVYAPYLQFGSGPRHYTAYLIAAYTLSVVLVLIRYPKSQRGLSYNRQFFRFMRWFVAILGSFFGPPVAGYVTSLKLPETISLLAVGSLLLGLLGAVLGLSLLGTILGISDIFQVEEDFFVEEFQWRRATPNYEAILSAEEFQHVLIPPPTRKEFLRKRWREWRERNFA